MKVTYDSKVEAVYVYLLSSIGAGMIKKTYACDPSEVGGEVNLDFDESGRLLGIEIFGASRLLPTEFLSKAERATR